MSLTNTPTALTIGGATITLPVWVDWIMSGHQFLVAAGGFVLIVLTIRGKLLDNAIKREKLKDLREEDDAGAAQ